MPAFSPSTPVTIEQFGLTERRQLRRFVEFPYSLYRDNPNWVPKLRMEYLGNRLLGQVGMFEERFPFHKEAKTAFFIAYRRGRPVGTISASIDSRFNKYHQTNTGAFGFFESIDDQEVATQLLDAAETWCKRHGALDYMGPLNFSTNHTCGLLVDAFDSPPIIEMPYNFHYYPRLIETYGLKKIKDLYSLQMPLDGLEERLERLQKIGDRVRERLNVTLRPIDKKNLRNEVRVFVDLYNEAWRENWGFVPISYDEADLIAKSLEIVLEPRLFLFAEVDGKPVAVAGALPDLNWALRLKPGSRFNPDWLRLARMLLRKSRIHGGRLLLYGVREEYRKRGLEGILFAACFKAGIELGYTYGDVGWILEDNELMLRTAAAMQATPYKTYRIYGRNPANG